MTVWKDEKKDYWIAKFQHQKRQYKKEGLRTKREAVLWEATERQKVNARPITEIPSISFQGLATEYLEYCQARMQLNTYRQKAFVYRELLAFIGDDIPAIAITTKIISDFLNVRSARDGKRAANRDLKDVKALYNWGINQDIIYCKSPCRAVERLPEDAYIPYVPPTEDVAMVKLAAGRDEKDFIECLYHLMARKSEIVRLTWEDVNFEQNWVRLYTRKRRGGELQEDYMPMNKTLYQTLKDRWKRRNKGTPFVFEFSAHKLRYMMDRVCKKARVKPFGFHAIRHHVSSVMNDSGKATMKQIQMLLRHKRQSTTEIYLHSISHDLYDAVRVLDGQSSTDSTLKKRLKIKGEGG